MTKILNICHADYANYSFANAAALRSIGHDAKALALTKHAFGYDEQAELTTEEDMREQIRDAEIIQIMHSCPVSYSLIRREDEVNKKIFVYHTGSRFRQEPQKFNNVFNPIIDRGFTDQTEFMKLGIKNAAYVAVAVDTEKIKPENYFDYSRPGKLILAHYPSKSQVKGTEKIKEMLLPYQDLFDIRISTETIPHSENLRRMQECDIYLELFAPDQNGKEYGCFGVTAFEAAAMGKIVLTQNLNSDVYENAYGDENSLFSNIMNESLLKRQLDFLLKSNSIRSMQQLTREVLVNRHSYKASGERISKLIGL